jgi:hypothetical protein
MKIVITITAAEISTLIQQHLAKDGLRVSVEEIKFHKDSAIVTTDAPLTVRPAAPVEPETPEALGAAAFNSIPPAAAPPPPALAVVDGGQANVDMDAILKASAQNATNPGKFPLPERQLMEGESFDFPGDKR